MQEREAHEVLAYIDLGSIEDDEIAEEFERRFPYPSMQDDIEDILASSPTTPLPDCILDRLIDWAVAEMQRNAENQAGGE